MQEEHQERWKCIESRISGGFRTFPDLMIPEDAKILLSFLVLLNFFFRFFPIVTGSHIVRVNAYRRVIVGNGGFRMPKFPFRVASVDVGIRVVRV